MPDASSMSFGGLGGASPNPKPVEHYERQVSFPAFLFEAALVLVGQTSDQPTMLACGKRRFHDPQKFLPVAFVSATIGFLFFAYLGMHIAPMLQLETDSNFKVDHERRFRGSWQLLLFLYLTSLQLISYVRSILEHPGEIPKDDPQWAYTQPDGRPGAIWVQPQEVKKNGERRHCKWCWSYKPDRCHHCRVCKQCILKMDHHCPWIYNCVGFGNYKYFFLLLLYSVLDTHFIVWTMFESVQRCIEKDVDTPFFVMFITFFAETLAFFMAVLVTVFFGFHILLTFKGMTTIEYCEKSAKREAEGQKFEGSPYDLGLCGNARAVLGDNMFLWFFPCSRPSGDGLNFISDETYLCKDLEFGKGPRRRGHQRTQRPARTYGSGPSYYGYGAGGSV